MARKKVSVVVLGDVGRSPRMLYHAISLSKENFDVDLVGYSGSALPHSLMQFENLRVVHIPSCPEFRAYLPLLFAYALKVIWQSVTLFFTLLCRGRSHYLLVQNPPSIPTLPVCWCYARLARSDFIIDWHNYAFSILSLTLGPNHKLVKISKLVEGYFGKKADVNFCVTRAMKEDLAQNWNIQANVLYDRANDTFAPLSDDGERSKESIRSRLSAKYLGLKDLGTGAERIPLLVSSTSWTPDEDFSILLNALEEYDETGDDLPNLLCAITGKGPEKEFYKQKIRECEWKKVSIVTPWLDAEDYPLLLSVADLGVCLHASSSGLDLPMKVVDMFGCGIPVCALDFKCLNELVKHGENGFVFKNSMQLFEQLCDWFRFFPSLSKEQSLIRANVRTFRDTTWHQHWRQNAKPFFSPDQDERKSREKTQ